MFAIEKNVPVPYVAAHISGRPPIYPFNELQVGESFYVPQITCKQRQSIQSQMRYRARKRGVRFISRKMEGGLRIWRVG